MARVHFVKKARKEIPNAGIKVGDSYYWWAFRYGGKHVSKTPPKSSQLTQSEYLSTYLSCEENVSDALASFNDGGCLDDLTSALEEAKDELEQLKDDCEDKVSNLENAFPGGSPTIDLLQQRVEDCESTISELEDAISTCEGIEQPDEDEDEEHEWEVDDDVLYRDKPYHVTKVIKVSVEDGIHEEQIEITDETGNTTIKLTPSMCQKEELTVVKEDENEDWRQEAVDAVEGINWNAE